jgi:hypothetical protein
MCSVSCKTAATAAAVEDDASGNDDAGSELFMTEERKSCRQGLCCMFPTRLKRKVLFWYISSTWQDAAAKTVQESPKPLRIQRQQAKPQTWSCATAATNLQQK